MTGFAPIMWSVWIALVVVLTALYIYRSRLTRDEDDHIILDDSFNNIRTEQAAMAEKVHKVEPLMHATGWLSGAMTLVVIGYYVVDFMNQFK